MRILFYALSLNELHFKKLNFNKPAHSITPMTTPMTHAKKALVLFKGTGSVDRVLERMGYEVVSVDWLAKFRRIQHSQFRFQLA